MAIVRALFQRVSGLFNKSQRDRDLEAELESHIQLHIDDNLKSGMTPEGDAAAVAHGFFGGLDAAQLQKCLAAGLLKNFLHRYSYAQPEFGLMSLGAFASIGLALLFLGVFSVMAYTVSLQTQEIGVRMALGAQRAAILRMVLVRGLLLLVAGICLGLVGALFVARLLQSQVWGVSFKDPWTFATVSVTVIVVGLLACLLRARRAATVDPMIALRYE